MCAFDVEGEESDFPCTQEGGLEKTSLIDTENQLVYR